MTMLTVELREVRKFRAKVASEDDLSIDVSVTHL
jgi:hypothetical protein